jgi:hypothetical protein
MKLRLSDSVRLGPFRFRLSVPLGKGRARVSAGTRIGEHGWAGVSAPLGGRRRRAQ